MSRWSLEGDFVEVSRQRGGEQRRSDDKTQSLEKYTVREEGSLFSLKKKKKVFFLTFIHFCETESEWRRAESGDTESEARSRL